MNFAAKVFNDDAYTEYFQRSPVPVIGVIGGSDVAVPVISRGVVRAAERQQPPQRLEVVALPSADRMRIIKEQKPYDMRFCRAPFKTNWCKKHQTEVFASVIVLFDWDACDIADRVAFQTAVAKPLEAVRQRLRGSPNTTVHLVLYTKLPRGSEFPPAGGFNNVDEALVVLRHHCNLDQRQLFVLYANGEDQYNISLLQRAVTDAALRFHREEISRIKRLKADVARSNNHPFMIARHRFKCGWHSMVLGDAKGVVHNFDKAYNALRATNTNPTLGARIAASMLKWHTTCVLINGAIANNAALTVIEPYVNSFLQHMQWIEQPLMRSGGGGAGHAASGSSFTSAAAPALGGTSGSGASAASFSNNGSIPSQSGSVASPVVSGPAGDFGLRESEDDLAIRRFMLAWLIVDMYKGVAMLLETAVAQRSGSLATLPTAVLAPAYHYQCAAKYLHSLRNDLQRAVNSRNEALALATAEDVEAARALAAAPMKRLPHVGFEDPFEPQMLDRVLATTSPLEVSNTMNECLLLGANSAQILSMPRLGQQLALAMAEHYFFTREYGFCIDKLVVLQRSADFVLWGPLRAIADGLAVRCCRAILESGDFMLSDRQPSETFAFATAGPSGAAMADATTAAAATRELFPASQSAASKAAEITDRMLRCMLNLVASSRCTPNTQKAIAAEIGAWLQRAGHSRPLLLVRRAADEQLPMEATACFSDAYIEAGSNCSTTLTVRLTTSTAVPLRVVRVKAVMAAVGAASGPARDRQVLPLPQHDVVFNCDDTTRLSASSPLQLSKLVVFGAAALMACTELHVDLGIPPSPTADASTHAPLTVIIAFDHRGLASRFEHRKYDHHADCAVTPQPHTTRIHRPLIRVAPPVPMARIEIVQGLHAVEGEDYGVLVRIVSEGDPVDAALLSIPFVHDVIEVVDPTAASEGVETDVAGAAAAEPTYFPAPLANPERPYCIYKLRRALHGVGEVYEHRIVFRCARAGKFEIPLRLDYATPKCAAMTLHHTLRLHVCHPVFAYMTVSDTFAWSHHASHRALAKLPDPEQRAPGAGSLLAVPSQASSALFVESSELRVEEVHHAPANTSFDGLLLHMHGGGGNGAGNVGNGSFVWDSAVVASAIAANTPNPVAVQLYSVQRTQIPSETHGALQPLTLRSGLPFVVACKFSNSLQCPMLISDAYIAPPAAGGSGAGGGADALSPTFEVLQVVGKEAMGLPCVLDVDGEFTMVATLRYNGPPTPAACLGAAVLVLTRLEGADGSNEEGAAPIQFQLPLPDAQFVAPPLRLTMEHPAFAVVGRPFPLTCWVTNDSLSATAEVKLAMMLPIASSADSPTATSSASRCIAAGRTTATLIIAPKRAKRVVFKIVPLAAGPLPLPAVTALAKDEIASTSLSRPDDTRCVFVYPSDAAAPGTAVTMLK